MASLDQHVNNEINYYLENVAEYHFRGSDVDSGAVREQLLDDAASLLSITFENLMTVPLTHLQKGLLLEFVKSHLQHDMSRKLMIELPDAYNRWMGSTIVTSQIHKYDKILITTD